MILKKKTRSNNRNKKAYSGVNVLLKIFQNLNHPKNKERTRQLIIRKNKINIRNLNQNLILRKRVSNKIKGIILRKKMKMNSIFKNPLLKDLVNKEKEKKESIPLKKK